MTDTDRAKPGDAAPPGTTGTGENLCRHCNGSGRIESGPCPDCAGTGKVTEPIGGA
ncbi:hypothetical protein [Methylobacterium isbiliense]|uniref:Chaperone protein DnaJ n=1 Tax=Methylobacterium isbiliense TaxID=315478 RepID=A0ABQ4SIC2_9HYPH|nr:hypothetical protein [Methylobacterium isbiliense]MDN3626992.1 hypothetical protein [Methylobacterium isbiliense]GJE02887.1 hypothetical protein GMJLKIPL_4836 [Methylobacterium isbiliense]